jgi:hypothetical protein
MLKNRGTLVYAALALALAAAFSLGGFAVGRFTAPQPPPRGAPPQRPPRGAPPQINCARFTGQESIPDNSHLQPGTKQLQTWRVKNCGATAWSHVSARLRFSVGPVVGPASRGPSPFPVPVVQPGQVGTVSVPFTTPMVQYHYIWVYELTEPDGSRFGDVLYVSFIVS